MLIEYEEYILYWNMVERNRPWRLSKEYFRDGTFWSTIETPWKLGCFDFIEEFDDEETFKNELLRIINQGGIIGKVWIKKEHDNYIASIKLWFDQYMYI